MATKKLHKKRGPIDNAQTRKMREQGYITVREAAEIGGVGVIRIYALINKGDLAGLRVGSRRYVQKQSVELYFTPQPDGPVIG